MKLRPDSRATPSDDIHIASLVIYVRPEHRLDTIAFLDNIPSCTIYQEENKAALVVVLEVCNEQNINTTIDDLNAREGILSVNLVYHHCDSATTLNQEINT
jgi:nitrate reductase NapD